MTRHSVPHYSPLGRTNDRSRKENVDEEVICDDVTGVCVAPSYATGITNCIYCGKELVQHADGNWYTWDADLLTGHPRPQATS